MLYTFLCLVLGALWPLYLMITLQAMQKLQKRGHLPIGLQLRVALVYHRFMPYTKAQVYYLPSGRSIRIDTVDGVVHLPYDRRINQRYVDLTTGNIINSLPGTSLHVGNHDISHNTNIDSSESKIYDS